jgi:hypothetical protein
MSNTVRAQLPAFCCVLLRVSDVVRSDYPSGVGAFETTGAIIGLLAGGVGVVNTIHGAITRQTVERQQALMQAEIRRVSFEHETRFSALHQRRVEVLAELNARLVRAQRALGFLVHPLQETGEPSLDEKAAAAAVAGNSFRDYFLENRIWLDKDLADTVGAFDHELGASYVSFGQVHRDLKRDPNERESGRDFYQTWHEIWKKASEELPAVHAKIEDRFRQLLGVHAPPAAPENPT